MGARSSHHLKSNGETAVGQNYSVPNISNKSSSSSPRHYKRSKKQAALVEDNNNVDNTEYVYSITDRKQWDSFLELTLEKSLSGDPDSLAISPLKINVWLETQTRFHFKISDSSRPRFEVSLLDAADESVAGSVNFMRRIQDTLYDVEYGEKPFSVKLSRRSTGHILFDTTGTRLDFEDEKLRISTAVHSKYIYGLGEHQKRFLIDTSLPHNFVFWAHDSPPTVGKNLYGSHPFFLALEEDGNAYGVWLKNSCALEVNITPGQPSNLTYTSNGGVLDFYIFTGPSPLEVVQQYQQVVGLPHLPPYWALGFHLSSWGYESVDELRKTIERMRNTGIPYEAQWTDIDMMNKNESWTTKDKHLSKVVKDLHSHGQRYIPNVNPSVSLQHIAMSKYSDFLRSGVFINNLSATRPLVGKVWAGECVYPDFTHPDVYKYWYSRAESLFSHTPFDGLWLDMNEPSNFVSGCQEDCSLTSSHPKDHTTFVPDKLAGVHLFHKTVCPSARQYAGYHYELHNLYGHTQMCITDRVCKALRGKRSLIISRSTFSGSGKYGGHWTGDNNSKFSDLRYSISDMMDFNLFGIPLVGADIGGFFGSCSEELMIRWMQVGSFYPFMRNHNSHPELFGAAPQDPARYSLEAQQIMRDIVNIRYSLLPYLYTLLYDNHTKGSPVVRPLYMMYPKDKRTYSLDEQFMWGSCLLVSPCVQQGQTKIDVYFPYDIWYDFYTGTRLSRVGSDLELPSPIDHINVHIRGGSIVLTQTPAKNTTYSRRNDFGILAALSSAHTARGRLYWDDGDVLNPVESQNYNLINFSIEQNRLTTTIEKLGYSETVMQLRLVQVFGLYVQPDRVLVNGKPAVFSYNELQSVLQLDQISVNLMEPLVIEW